MLAVVFPGQGSQAVGMACDFADAYPEARAALEEADAAFGGGLIDRLREGPESELARTEITQPAILAASIAMYRVVAPRLPKPPAYFAGHSLGEYSAVVAAGGLPLSDAIKLVRRRGAFMQEAVPEGRGAMTAIIGLSGEEVERACASVDGIVCSANYNSPVQTVIAGSAPAVKEASALLKEAGARRIVELAVSAPFHSELMQPAADKLAAELAEARFGELCTPVLSNVTTDPYSDADRARELLREQVTAPVRWVGCVERARALGVTAQLEVGPGKVLSGLAAKIDRSLVRTNIEKVGDLDAALAKLAEALT